MEMLLCVNARHASFLPIVHMDPVNALFWNLVSGWNNSKTLPLHSCLDSKSAYFCVSMTPSPHPSTSSLRPLNPATSHNNNNNNGGLHACVDSGFLVLAIFIFFLSVYSAQASCARSVSSSLFWVNLSWVESFTMDPFGPEYSWNDAKAGGKKIVLLRGLSTAFVGGW